VGSETLDALSVSAALASHYVKAGWLARLGRGLFMFPGDELQREPTLKFLAKQIPGFHVAGKTALAWRGVLHNVTIREPLFLSSEKHVRLPEWFTKRFPSRLVARKLFNPTLPKNFGLAPLPESPDGPLVSVPERALLEMLNDVGVGQSVREARNIMEGLGLIRMDVLGPLLRHCLRVKVVRLCVQWADELHLQWAAQVRKSAKGTRAFKSTRWTSCLRDGSTLILKS
jgi:hypothetical protein